ncbi:MAG: pilin [bacterium]|nr:pilin [bacterium]
MKKHLKILFLLIIPLAVIFFIGNTEPVSALLITDNKLEYKMLEPLPCLDGRDCNLGLATSTIQSKDLATYINGLFKLAIGIATLLAMVMITWGGFEYATSDAISGKSEGKEKIQNALIGLILVLLSYIILYTIDPRLVTFNTALDKVTIQDVDQMVFDPANSARLTELGQERADSSVKKIELYKAINDNKKDLEDLEAYADSLLDGDPEKERYLNEIISPIKKQILADEATLAALSAFKKSTSQYFANPISVENAGMTDGIQSIRAAIFGGSDGISQKSSAIIDPRTGKLVPARVDADGKSIPMDDPSIKSSVSETDSSIIIKSPGYENIETYFNKLEQSYVDKNEPLNDEQKIILNQKKDFAHKISELEFDGQASQIILEDVNNKRYIALSMQTNELSPRGEFSDSVGTKETFLNQAQSYENKINANINNIESSKMSDADKKLYVERANELLAQIKVRKDKIK